MSIDMNAIQRKIYEITKQLSGDVSLQRLFQDEFVKQHTNYSSARELFTDAGISSQEEFDRWIETTADAFISKNTSFNTWSAFLSTAAREFASEKRDLLRSGLWKDEEFGDPNQFENIHIYLNFHG